MPDVINLKPEKKEEERESAETTEQQRQPQQQMAHVIEPQLATYQAETIYHEWEAPEFEDHDRDKTWYTYVVCLTIGAVFLSLITGSGLSALIFGLIGTIIFMMGSQKPRNMQFAISPMGISCGEKHYSFNDMESFWIHYNPQVQEISFKGKKMLSPYIKIPLGEQDPMLIRSMVSNYLPEEKQEEEIVDLILRKIKF